MGRKGKSEEGESLCEQMQLSEDDCVNKKIGTFCKNLKDNKFCKEQFERLKSGEIDADELAKILKDKFGEQDVAQARKKTAKDLGE